MEPAILGILSLTVTIMLYLDRTRRNETKELRKDMNTGLTELRTDMNTGLTELRADMNTGLTELRTDMNTGLTELRTDMNTGFAEQRKVTAKLRKEIRTASERTDARIDQLTTTVINLAESLGQAKGRTETLIATE